MNTTWATVRRMPLRRLGRTASPVVATALLAACTASPSAAPKADAAPPKPCVEIKAGPVDGAMGLRSLALEMVNCGSRPYTVKGYPTVRVLDGDRKRIDVTVTEGSSAVATIGDATPKPVILRPGEKAVAGLLWRNTVTDPAVTAVRATYLEVAPATGAPWQTVKPDAGIDLGTTGKVGVSPWKLPPRR
ncbi:DUF4232 domain-containing protein [Streptomyces netropsis]|uniref:DUF4232 domain-containing protein n=1 Tax=Streptomyces netropsis TaxID=55404 RepID=A0A7W7PDR1_STRNE|nr:DUF4232 domain-containing protein [Streptomyces netropsis]MBB4885393.1 hypothetical protein [Streptomyces netropsis]